MDSTSTTGTRSDPLKVGLTVAGAAGLSAILVVMSPAAWWIVLIGIGAALVLLVLYMLLLKWRRRRRVMLFDQALASSSPATPRRVADTAAATGTPGADPPGDLQACRRRFRAAGKDIYSLPW